MIHICVVLKVFVQSVGAEDQEVFLENYYREVIYVYGDTSVEL